ncbi:uncharacterized protein LOC121921802 [Sceloporus undulatus]|uniref:uncharacterized protein LOC121921802 n=1 Tax=Sceloporus undulatus TaxID=8520 RepID=UPI001C4C318F|nr:uncharacterized protein LOC121921802 [Sceloporus undulatus]XP_042306291.1 uncharacterized protein LOC121921802 [Sceloporus undulatus]XP_042306292.1 uncharacterized protein LOC121921802 [Sceloporus undulatus]
MDTAQETEITVFLVPEIKMEEQDPTSPEEEEIKEEDPLKIDRSREEDNHMVKQEQEEEPSRNWDARLEEFLKTLQPPHSPGETPEPPEVQQQMDPEMTQVPSQGETETNKQSRGLWVSSKTQPHLTGVNQLEYGTHLDATSYGKGKEKALAGDAAKLEMRRRRFRMSSYQDADGPQELCRQLQQLCRQWLNPDRNTKERMLELVILEQFLAIVPADMHRWLWENGPVTCAKAVTLAEDFLQSQQEARDLLQQGTQSLPDTVEVHLSAETKQEDKASANLLGGECLRESGKENLLLKRSEKMEQLPTCLKTDIENNFLCHSESSESQQKGDRKNGNATEKNGDLFVSSHGHCKAGSESTSQQDDNTTYNECRKSVHLPVHENSHVLEKPYKCWHCGQSFSSSLDLLSHERNHVGEQLYKCSHCGGSERIHMGRKPSKCSHCGNTFGCNPQEETYGGKKFHTCTECGEKYIHISGLLKHQGVHRGEKPYKCLKCGENFGTYSNFRAHCRTHTGEKQYKCLQCEMCFSSITRLRAHERIHVAVCSSCGKSFSQKSELIEHERTHTREDSFVCFDCGKAFEYNSELVAHVRTHKDKKLECPDTKKTLICAECGDTFKYASAFKAHQRVHRGEHRKEQQDQEECVERPKEIKRKTEEEDQDTEEPRKRQRLTMETRSKTAVAKAAVMEGSASETELTDEQAQPKYEQGSPNKNTVQQLMKTAVPQQQVPMVFDDDSEDNDADSDGPPVRSRRCIKQNVTQKILDRTLMNYIVEETVPLQNVHKPTFLALVCLGLPKDLTIMCANTLRDRIEKKAASMRESFVSRMGTVSHVATTADCWTDGKRNFLGVTAHWISTTTLKREFGALAFKHLKGCLTYSVLVKALRDIHVQYGIHDKVVCMTTDNGSSFVKTFQVLRAKELADAAGSIVDDNNGANQDKSEMEFVPISEILDTGNQAEEDAPELNSKLPPYQRCASYTLNLVATHDVEAMLSDSSQCSSLSSFQKHFCTLMRKCRKLWSKQNNSVQIAAYIYEQCGMYLTVPDKTRWKAIFEALMQLNKLLCTVPLKVDAIMDRCSLARITDDECLVLQEYTEIMGPLALSLDILQRENGMFMGYLLPTLHSLDRKLQGLENKPVPYTHCLPLLRGVREALRKRFAGIWEDKELLLAACLHPRFKVDWLDSAQTERSAAEALLKAELKGAVTEITEGISEEDQERDSGLLDFFDIRPQQGKSVVDPVEEEISKYLKTPSRELSSLLAFPSIQQSFLKYNTGVPSSAAATHLFCRDGNVMTVERRSLVDDVYEHLVLLKQNRAFSLLQVSKHSSV